MQPFLESVRPCPVAALRAVPPQPESASWPVERRTLANRAWGTGTRAMGGRARSGIGRRGLPVALSPRPSSLCPCRGSRRGKRRRGSGRWRRRPKKGCPRRSCSGSRPTGRPTGRRALRFRGRRAPTPPRWGGATRPRCSRPRRRSSPRTSRGPGRPTSRPTPSRTIPRHGRWRRRSARTGRWSPGPGR